MGAVGGDSVGVGLPATRGQGRETRAANGFQRVGDQIWAAADMRAKGFLFGATSGRTTLAGEGLQHQDGHSQLAASAVPNLYSYDPAFSYEIAVIIRDGLKRMYEQQENVFYYLTVQNEPYPQPAMPEGVEEGILRGLYKFRACENAGGRPRIHLFGSAAILMEALKAQEMLEKEYGVAADVWSATSYTLVRREALDTERWNMLHPGERPRKPYITQLLEGEPWPIVAASDYVKLVPDQIARWAPAGMLTLGTDGFGRSEARAQLRDFFEVDARHIAWAALVKLAEGGKVKAEVLAQARKALSIDASKANPRVS